MFKYGVISGPYFAVFRLNTEIYFVNIRIKSEYKKIRTRNNFVFGHLLRSNRFGFCIIGSTQTISFVNNSSAGAQQERAGIPSCELVTVTQYVKEGRKDAETLGLPEFIFHHLFSSVCSW